MGIKGSFDMLLDALAQVLKMHILLKINKSF